MLLTAVEREVRMLLIAVEGKKTKMKAMPPDHKTEQTSFTETNRQYLANLKEYNTYTSVAAILKSKSSQ